MPPPRKCSVENTALADALEQTGWTHAAAIRHINTAAARHGVRLGYDRSSIGKWLTGTIPRPEAVTAAVEAFSLALGRPPDTCRPGLADGTNGTPGPRTADAPRRARRPALDRGGSHEAPTATADGRRGGPLPGCA